MTLDGFTCPCSFAQRRLWFLDRLNPGGCEYNIPAAIRLRDPIDPVVLEQSINALVRRHESLRTTFASVDGDPVQVVAPDLFVPVTVRAIGGPLEPARTEALRIAEAEAAAPFDLERGPLLRVALLSLGDHESVLLITTHHIVSDGWSMDVFFRELTTLYEACAAGRPSPLPELPIQYADYAVWQQEPQQQRRMEEQLDYWRRQLAGAAPLQLPADYPRPAVSSYRGRRESIRLDAALTARLQALSRAEGTTLFMTLLACFALLLARCSGERDITIGTLTAGRDRLETEGLIGFFVNTLALRIDLAGNPGVRGLLARVKQTALDAYAHADVPFERLVEALRPDRDLSRTPLVQITFQLFKLPGSDEVTATPRAEMLDVRKGTAKFDLALDMWEEDGGLSARMEYGTDLFEPGTIRRLLGHFETLVRTAAADPDRRIDLLPLLTPAEAERLLYGWNDTERPDFRGLCAPDLFERQVRRTPAAPAVIDGSLEWTYGELDRRAAAIAGRLRALGVAADSRVGICMRRSAALVAAMLGVWKAGGAYVPLDPSYPPERLAFMAADAQVSLVIADEDAVVDFAAPIVRIPSFAPGAHPFENTAVGNCGGAPAPHHLAYILYTSGSTGRPKGVAIEHRQTAALIHWATTFYPAGQLAGVLASTSISFDLSVFELFAPLCSGGAVILAENALALAALLAADRVTLINTVPSAAAELVRAGAVPAGTRVMNLAGEPLDPSLVDEIFRGTNVERIFNLYGPTEDTTYSTCAAIERGESWTATIGRPLPNRRAYILDPRLQPVPIGVAGELYLGGDGVARGYWNQPALTAERFIASPFVAHDRLYRTGDLARYRESGDIEFLGRADGQVKLRGFRIELGEIEAALRRDPGVADAVVQLRQDAAAGPQLVAYVVPTESDAVTVRLPPSPPGGFGGTRKPDTTGDAGTAPRDTAAILRNLAAALPHYMIPSAVVVLDRLPLTPNGKVDRAALPSPAETKALAASPRTAVERAIAALWEDVLGVRGVGLTDNFFELGGHSLLLLRLQSRLRDAVGDVPLLDLFRFPTVQTLAAHLAPGEAGRSRDVAAAHRRAHDQRARVRQQALGRSSRQSLSPQAGSRIPDPGSPREGGA